MMIKLSSEHRRQISAEGQRTYPDECCGILLGLEADGVRDTADIRPIVNARDDGQSYHRFVISPEDYMRAELDARKRGLDVIGVYHSHPDHPAKPSDYDREHALPFYSYVIVSIHQGTAVDLKSFTLSADRESMEEEEIV
jgi:proteasome lid subunit RPN8/RPN11